MPSHRDPDTRITLVLLLDPFAPPKRAPFWMGYTTLPVEQYLENLVEAARQGGSGPQATKVREILEAGGIPGAVVLCANLEPDWYWSVLAALLDGGIAAGFPLRNTPVPVREREAVLGLAGEPQEGCVHIIARIPVVLETNVPLERYPERLDRWWGQVGPAARVHAVGAAIPAPEEAEEPEPEPGPRTREGRILALLADGAWRTAAEIGAALGLPHDALRLPLEQLCRARRIDKKRCAVGTPGLFRYRRPAEVDLSGIVLR